MPFYIMFSIPLGKGGLPPGNGGRGPPGPPDPGLGGGNGGLSGKPPPPSNSLRIRIFIKSLNVLFLGERSSCLELTS